MYHFWKTSLRDSLDDPHDFGKEKLKIHRVLMLLFNERRLYSSEEIPSPLYSATVVFIMIRQNITEREWKCSKYKVFGYNTFSCWKDRKMKSRIPQYAE